LSLLEKKLSTLIIDPSVVTSNIHVRNLLELSDEKKLFVPATLYEVIEEEKKAEDILRYFVWYPWKAKLSVESLKLIKRAEIYKYKEENIRDISPELDRLNVPFYVRQILLEEYSFLKENSALLLRFQKTLQYFRKIGISTLNLMNKLKDEKVRALYQIRGLQFIVAFLLFGNELLVQDPLLGKILTTILVIFDP
jgi:hypothetical protein